MWSLVKKIINLAGDKAGNIKASVASSFFYALFTSLPYLAIYYFFVDVTTNNLTGKTIAIVSGILLVSLLGGVVMKIITYRLQAWSGNYTAAKQRLDIGDRLKRVPMGFFNEKSLGEITTVLTSDISYFENQAIVLLDSIINGTLNIAISSVFLMIFDWRFGLIFLAGFMIAVVIIGVIQQKSEKIIPLRKKAETNAISSTLEYIRGISVFKLFHMGGKGMDNIKDSYKEYSEKSSELESKLMVWDVLLQCILKMAIGIIVLLAAILFINKNIDISVAIVIIIAGLQIFAAIEKLASGASLSRSMAHTVTRIKEVSQFPMLDADSKPLSLDRYDIEFKNVSFAYSGESSVIRNISLRIPENTMTAFVGTSGSGKTTIARLIARFWDANEGKIKIGGQDIRGITTDKLLDYMSIVFQNVYLFNDTIANNIRYGKPDAAPAEIEAAARKARAHGFIMALPDGYDTVVGESGSHLSGGEKQRISIARAILKDAPIVLLDEATSSIDPDNEVYIQQAINELVQNKTLIVIAHRLTTIKDAEQIIVMDNGVITQRGTHEELMERGGQYRQYWDIAQQVSS